MLHVNILFRTLWIQRYRNDWHFAPHLPMIFSAEKCQFKLSHHHSVRRCLLEKCSLESNSCPTSGLTAPSSAPPDLCTFVWFPCQALAATGWGTMAGAAIPVQICQWTKYGLSRDCWCGTPGAGMRISSWVWAITEQNVGISRTYIIKGIINCKIKPCNEKINNPDRMSQSV